MAEALKPLLQIVVKNVRASLQAGGQSGPVAMTFLNMADRLLEGIKVQQEGDTLQLEASVAYDASLVGGLSGTIGGEPVKVNAALPPPR